MGDSPVDLDSQRAPASPVVASGSDPLPIVTVADLLWFFYLYPLRTLSAFGPPGLIHSIGSLALPFVQLRARKRREKVMRRMLAAQGVGMTPDRARRTAREFIASSSFRMLDDLVLSRPSCAGALRCTGVEGLENLERGKSGGKGVIVLTSHFCASRIARRYLAAIGYPMLTVRDRISDGDWWGRLGRRILEPRHRELVHAVMGEVVFVQDPGCTLEILRTLRSGGLVNIHFDGRSGIKNTRWLFLGVPRSFSTGIFDLVRLSGCSVVPMLSLGKSTAFRVIFSPPLDVVEVAGREAFMRANLPAFVGAIEKQIQDHPGEWEQWESF
ncbi:MAG TPA: lysophospholipid acyltransferase family protein [Bryobacteraceae bacterium]|nr:lysophospholipid acyltransferase family protein [Bryobacteraceae bacterium]